MQVFLLIHTQFNNLLVIKQKKESQNGGYTPTIRTRACAYQEVRNISFLEDLECLFFCSNGFEIRPFALITKN